MKKKLSKKEAQNRISEFFKKGEFNSEQMRKIKRLAMAYQIRLGIYRKLFCKKCLSQLKGKLRITKTHKTIICDNCKTINRHKLV